MNLKTIRKEKRKTQTEVAKDLNIPISTYNGYEKETSQPNIETIIKLAKYFDVSTDELLGIKKEEVTLTEKSNLLKKINKLTEVECYKLSIFADGLITNRNQETANKILVLKEEE